MSLGALLVGSVALVLAGCDSAPSGSEQQPTARSDDEAAEWAASRRTNTAAEEGGDGATVEDEALDGPSPGAEEFPCTVLDQAAIEQLLGNPVEPPAWTLEEVEDDGVGFQAETCSWLTFDEGATEIVLQVSWPDHFEQGEIVCWQPEADETEDSEVAVGDSPGLTPPSPAMDDPDAHEPAVDDEAPAPEPEVEPIADLGSTAWWLYDSDSAFGVLHVCHVRVRLAVEVSTAAESAAREAAVSLARRTLDELPR